VAEAVFLHREGPMGSCWKIPGQGDTRDFVVCDEADYGQGDISVISFDVSGRVKTKSVLIQTWTDAIRTLEKQKHCSSLSAGAKKVSFNAIEISIFLNSFDVAPQSTALARARELLPKCPTRKKWKALRYLSVMTIISPQMKGPRSSFGKLKTAAKEHA
jgi:hypothetical protein